MQKMIKFILFLNNGKFSTFLFVKIANENEKSSIIIRLRSIMLSDMSKSSSYAFHIITLFLLLIKKIVKHSALNEGIF